MPLSISLKFDMVILSFKYSAALPWELYDQFQLIAGIIGGAGVAVSTRRASHFRAQQWYLMVGNTMREPPAETDALWESYPNNFAIDLISPVYYKADGAAWKDNVSLVLNIVNEQMYWRPNPSFGFRVYVMLGVHEKFTLAELKRIAMFVCRFEGWVYEFVPIVPFRLNSSLEAIDTLPPVRRMLNNKDWILSNCFNPVFRNLTLIEVYSRIRDVTEIPELCTLFNAREEGKSKYAAYPGYKDSTYFKVICIHFMIIFEWLTTGAGPG